MTKQIVECRFIDEKPFVNVFTIYVSHKVYIVEINYINLCIHSTSLPL